MLTILSPAKSLDFQTPPTTKKYSQPQFLEQAAELVAKLRHLSENELRELMSISDKLSKLNKERYANWTTPFSLENAKQACLAFTGDVYTGLQADDFSTKDFEYAQDHLRILSGLYGILRPLDLMQAYRLEMGTKPNTKFSVNLPLFWKELVTTALNKELAKAKEKVLVNLASNEYFAAVDQSALKYPVITPVFKDWKNGQYKIISFFAKKARGMMARYMVMKRVACASDLKNFDWDGYAFTPEQSTETTYLFLRR